MPSPGHSTPDAVQPHNLSALRKPATPVLRIVMSCAPDARTDAGRILDCLGLAWLRQVLTRLVAEGDYGR